MQEEKEVIKNDSSVEDSNEGMSFWDHLEVLRWALFRSAMVLTACLVVTFWALPHIFDDFILAATSNDFFVYRWLTKISHGVISFSPDFNVQIININVASQFMTHISTSISLAAVLAFPYFIWEVWKFIEPALYDNEIKHIRPAFIGGTLMFYLGCAIGYFLVFPFTFRFLMEYELSPSIQNQINLSSYIGNFTMLIMIMGIVFEMPLLAWLLSQFGILHKSFLRTYRRHAIVILLVAAAIITPSGDPFTLMLVFVPLFLLYEMSILVVRK
jgi:sec-independent protein translocase protein TatC